MAGRTAAKLARRDSGLTGLLLVDKPAGWTSHDVVAKVRRLAGQPRIGHTGTLDPMATGLLVLCLGTATRLAEYLTGHDKRYEAVVRLGVRTDTDDAEGQVLAERPVPAIDRPTLADLARAFAGTFDQRPPAYSALQVGGKRAYDAARRGAPLDLPARPVTVYSLGIHVLAPDTLGLQVHCGPGTYIRSLARDIGALLGCGGHLAALRRVSAGHFVADEAWTMEELEVAAREGWLEGLVMPPDEGLVDWPALILGPDHSAAFEHGSAAIVVPTGIGADHPYLRTYGTAGEFFGVAEVDPTGVAKAAKVIRYPISTVMSDPDTRIH